MALPAARAFALHACMRKRLGCKFGGPDYSERETIAEMRRTGVLPAKA